MSCCPGPERGAPFDPVDEGPSDDDVRRFGEESEYAEYADDAYGAIGRDVTTGSRAGLKAALVPVTAGVVVVAFVLTFVL